MVSKLLIIKYIFLLPHLLLYYISDERVKYLIGTDVEEMNRRLKQTKSLVYYLALYKAYRNVFYYRIGSKSLLVKWYLHPDDSFFIFVDDLGPSIFVLNHPYSTILNAKKIGAHFTVRNLTTLGNKTDMRPDEKPTIGDHVTLGANVTIIGDIKVGNNVVVGAGSVVVNDIPDNVIVGGVPCRILKHIG